MKALIVAYDKNRLIGRDNGLPWRLKADLRHFKLLTSGQAVIMGRKTFESIGRPLPNRRNIVLSTTLKPTEGVEVVGSVQQAFDLVDEAHSVSYVIGGASVYEQALPLLDALYVTEVEASEPGQVFFPDFDTSLWQEVFREPHKADAENEYDYSFVIYRKAR